MPRLGQSMSVRWPSDPALDLLRKRTDLLPLEGSFEGRVLSLAGRTGEAAEVLEQALERYERKENLAMVAQVRPRLEKLRK